MQPSTDCGVLGTFIEDLTSKSVFFVYPNTCLLTIQGLLLDILYLKLIGQVIVSVFIIIFLD